MGHREATAILAVITITLGCAGTIAVFMTAVTAHRSRAHGWGHFLRRALRLTLTIACLALLAELALIGADLATGDS